MYIPFKLRRSVVIVYRKGGEKLVRAYMHPGKITGAGIDPSQVKFCSRHPGFVYATQSGIESANSLQAEWVYADSYGREVEPYAYAWLIEHGADMRLTRGRRVHNRGY